MKFTEEEKGIIRRAFSKHYHSLMKSSSQCSGELWASIYAGEAESTETLLQKLLGKNEDIVSPKEETMVRKS